MKIRGQKVHTAEVERALLDLGMKEALVVARDEPEEGQRLVAYVVALVPPAPTASWLRRGLSERLSAHMMPTAFVVLDALPRMPNGKVDRRALPSPGHTRPRLDTPFVAPRTPVEDALAMIWAETLHLDEVGVLDHFLDLGGHSLLATQVISRVIQRFAVNVPMPALFAAPTIAAMAEIIVQHLATEAGDEEMSRLLADVEGPS